jgi:hypothetical protein
MGRFSLITVNLSAAPMTWYIPVETNDAQVEEFCFERYRNDAERQKTPAVDRATRMMPVA